MSHQPIVEDLVHLIRQLVPTGTPRKESNTRLSLPGNCTGWNTPAAMVTGKAGKLPEHNKDCGAACGGATGDQRQEHAGQQETIASCNDPAKPYVPNLRTLSVNGNYGQSKVRPETWPRVNGSGQQWQMKEDNKLRNLQSHVMNDTDQGAQLYYSVPLTQANSWNTGAHDSSNIGAQNSSNNGNMSAHNSSNMSTVFNHSSTENTGAYNYAQNTGNMGSHNSSNNESTGMRSYSNMQNQGSHYHANTGNMGTDSNHYNIFGQVMRPWEMPCQKATIPCKAQAEVKAVPFFGNIA